MESLSRPYHRRKLSNASSFSSKNAYDGALSGLRREHGGGPDVRVEDYREIFGGSEAASSIPVLDLSALEELSAGSNSDLGSSGRDYSQIFGGFRDEDIAVSYEELCARDQARAPSSTSTTSQDTDNLSHQSSDALKQFNMSYHKISQRSKDGLDGTTHVAKLHAVPGFTCFIDETAPPQKEAEKQKSPVVNNVHPSVDFSKGDFPEKQTAPPQKEAEKQKSSVGNNVHPSVDFSKGDFPEKQTSGSVVNTRSKHLREESLPDDKVHKKVEINLNSHPPTVPSSSALPTNVNDRRDFQKRSTSMHSGTSKSKTSKSAPGESSPTYFDEGLDVNSAAAASVAALKKAIEEAQETIRIAKESVVRKEEGLRSFSSRSFKDSLKVKDGLESAAGGEEQKEKDNMVKETFERVGIRSLFFPFTGRNHKYGATVVSPDVSAAEKISVAKKVIDETHGKFSEPYNKQCELPIRSSHEFGDRKIDCNSTEDVGETEAKSLDSAGKYNYKSGSSGAVDTGKNSNMTSAFEQADLSNDTMNLDDYQGNAEVTGTTNGTVECQGAVNEELKSVEKTCEPEDVEKGDAIRTSKEWEDKVDKVEPACFLHECRESNTYEASHEVETSVQRPKDSLVHESSEKKLGEVEDTTEDEKARESEENKDEVTLNIAHKLVKGLKNLTLSLKVEDEKKMPHEYSQHDHQMSSNEALGLLENKRQEVAEQEHIDNVDNAERHEHYSGTKGVEEAFQLLENGNELEEDHTTENHKDEDIGEKFYDVCELEINEDAQTYAHSMGKSEASPKEDSEMKEKENPKGKEEWKRLDEVHELQIDENSSSDYDDAEESESVHSSHGARNMETDTQEAYELDTNDNAVETSQKVDDEQVTEASCESQVEDTEAVEEIYWAEEKEIFERTSADQTTSEDNGDGCKSKAGNLENCCLAGVDVRQNETEENDVRSETSSDTIQGMETWAEKLNDKVDKISFLEEEGKLQPSHEERPRIRGKWEMGASQEPKEAMDVKTSQCRESKDEVRESGRRKVAGKEHQGRIEEETEKEREREKNRLAVERAIREVRERAFAEARERASVERANAEARQRLMAGAREKVAQASAGTKSSSERTCAESKLRVERAAVERATSEARQRALEKAMSLKNTSETRTPANGIRKSASSSNLETHAESALRSKAKFEKHNRIMERAAKALAEKEKRDQLALKEQAERNRLAESLDADIKRWSSGKEGNLRALLSTLQYILGPDSGWQPVSLTEIIMSSAVKKAYRKATLCVHPDKLQQRGASIQQKYICEKVFDLLKAAWTRFNSEER